MNSRPWSIILVLGLLLILGCGGGKAWRQLAEKYPPSAADKPVVVVMAQPGLDKTLEDLTAWAADQTVTFLTDSESFQVEDRGKTEALMREKRLVFSGAVEGESAVELGRFLPSKTLIVVTALVCRIGEVEAKSAPRNKATPLPSNQDGSGDLAEDIAFALLHGIGEGIGKGMAEALRTATVSVSIKKLDLDTGRVLSSLTLRAQGQGQGGPGALSKALGLLEGKMRRKLPNLFLEKNLHPLPQSSIPSPTGGRVRERVG